MALARTQKFSKSAKNVKSMLFMPLEARAYEDVLLGLREAIILEAWGQAMGANEDNVAKIDETHVFYGFSQRDIHVATSFIMWLADNVGGNAGFEIKNLVANTAPQNLKIAQSVLGAVVAGGQEAQKDGDAYVIARTLKWLTTHKGERFMAAYQHKLDVAVYRLKRGKVGPRATQLSPKGLALVMRG